MSAVKLVCKGCGELASRERFVKAGHRWTNVMAAIIVAYWERVPVCRSCDEHFGRCPGVADHWEFMRRVATEELLRGAVLRAWEGRAADEAAGLAARLCGMKELPRE